MLLELESLFLFPLVESSDHLSSIGTTDPKNCLSLKVRRELLVENYLSLCFQVLYGDHVHVQFTLI